MKINRSVDKYHYLVSSDEIGELAYVAAVKTLKLCKRHVPEAATFKNNKLCAFFRCIDNDNFSQIKDWGYDELDRMLACLLSARKSTDIKNHDIGNISRKVIFATDSKNSKLGFTLFVKLFSYQLWLDGVLLVPWGLISIVNNDELIDSFVSESGSNVLLHLRSLNSKSSFDNALDEKNAKWADRNSNIWVRLLFTTSLNNEESLTEEGVVEFLSSWTGSEPIARVPGHRFLDEVGNALSSSKSMIDKVVGKIREEAQKNALSKALEAAVKKSKRTSGGKKRDTKLNKGRAYKGILFCCEFALSGNEDVDLGLLFENTRPSILKKVTEPSSGMWLEAEEKAKEFVGFLFDAYDAWVDSAKLQDSSDHLFCKNLLVVYLLVYLPAFFKKRDGKLDRYPSNFNEFTCPYFVSRGERLTKLVSKDEAAPVTLITYITRYSERFGWINNTLYNRILKLDNFFTWVVENSPLIPDSSQFINTISPENYPLTSRGSTTVKYPIPAKYFGALISYCYTLEQMLEHINGMAYDTDQSFLSDDEFGQLRYTPVFHHDGKYLSVHKNPGVVDGEIAYVNMDDMEDDPAWSSLWGTKTLWSKEDRVGLELLNYTPIFYYEDKPYPLKHCRRFYSFVDYESDSVQGRVIALHTVRIIILMCETGIRQQHIKWLNINNFDSGVDNSCRVELEPLLVNTDKSHDQWISIVTHRVIDVCRRQKEWLNNWNAEGMHEPIWYGKKTGSKFGKFQPLFRMTNENVINSVDEGWAYLLFGFQDFIKKQLGDIALPDMVKYVERNSTTKSLDFDQHGSSADKPFDLDPSKVYRLGVRHTPHALRVTFVTEKMTYLPPSVIGTHMTGQTEYQVHYYHVVDTSARKTHAELLADKIAEGLFSAEQGLAPEIAARAAEIHAEMMSGIEKDPVEAITDYGLISLSNMADDKTGIEVLKAKKHTKLAFNDTHICPFNNTCPKEILKDYGFNKPCSVCPYAIRSVHNLPAISAAKDRACELQSELKRKILVLNKRPSHQVSEAERDSLMGEYDDASKDAFALEFTARQLYELHKAGFSEDYIVGKGEELKDHYQQLDIDEFDYILKRLVDIQNFPLLDSAEIQARFAYARKKLLIMDNDIAGLLTDSSGTSESDALCSQIKSMMAAKGLSVGQVFAMAKADMSALISPVADGPVTGNIRFIEGELT